MKSTRTISTRATTGSLIGRWAPYPVKALVLGLGLCLVNAVAMAAPPDLTNGGVPTSTKNLNLGPTGAHGWLYHVKDDTSESRQIKINTVDAGSPSDGLLAACDVILGADGTGAPPAAFTSDAMRALARAIADAEASNPPELKLLRWRAGSTTTVTLTLQQLGTYSPTAPFNCPKSATILEQGLAYVQANQTAGKFSFGTLALLAGNNPSNPANAARMARAEAEALALIPSQAVMNDMLAGKVSTQSKVAWPRGHELIVLAEYYLHTGDSRVLPAIEARAVEIANGQSIYGTMGHQFTNPVLNGAVNGPYNVGYGCINSAGMPCFLALLLAKECGITRPELQPAIDRAGRFFASYAGYGTIPYGEHPPLTSSHENGGKSGLAALALSMMSNHVEDGKFFAKMATAATSERMEGHTAPWFNYVWAPLGAAVGGEEAAAAHFSGIAWQLDLSRRWDGGFDFNTLIEGDDGGIPSCYGDAHMYVPALLTYALPLQQLIITGKNRNPASALASVEVSEAVLADEYDAASRTTSELVADLGLWSSKVQEMAAAELKLRTAEHATLVPQIIAIVNNTNAGNQRAGAAWALGKIANGSAAATLASVLTAPDGKLRYAAAEALQLLPQADRLAQVNVILAAAASTAKPAFPIDEEDPLQFAHQRICNLLFYSGNALGPKGVIWGSGINGIDRNLLYPAIRAVANNPAGQARGTLTATYPYLTTEDVNALAGTIIDSVKTSSPADKMFSASIRTSGLNKLQSHNIAEGVPLGKILAAEKSMKSDERITGLDALALYAGSSTLVHPDPGIIDFCELLVYSSPTYAADAQQVLDAIAADTNPVTATAFKTIQSIIAENPSLTLPAKHTRLHVSATDLAQGDTSYTWRKLHGAGQVTFTPNGTGSAKDTTLVFEGIPGQYLFEVTMSNSRGLTEAVETVAITLYNSGGTLLPNNPTVANAQSLAVPQNTTTPIVLGGTDPEGYGLSHAVTGQPSHGRLSGTPPYLTYTSEFGYAGADSFTFEVMDSETQTASATVSITVDPIAGLQTAVYEPFDYPVGLLNGKSGASEVGLAGTWAAHATTAAVASGSMDYGTLPTKGGRFEVSAGGNHWGGTRSISGSALAANGLLNDGATLWFSAVVGYGPNVNLANARIAVALANSGFSTGNFDYWILDEGAQLGSGVGFLLGNHDGVGGCALATQFQDLSKGDLVAGNIKGTWEGNGGSIGANQQGLIVCRITWAEDPEQPDTIEVFQPLTDLALPGAPISILNAVLDQSKFDTLTFCRTDVVKLDEIRLGPNYHSVLAGNLPLVADTTAPAPNPVGFHTPPTALNGTSVTMTAATAYDPHGVEYYFTCTSGGGHDSGWQSSTTYTNTGLTPGVQHSYTVTARDLSSARNATSPSASASVTLPTTLLVPDVTGMDQTTAEAVLVTYSFAVGTIGTTYSASVPTGEVISQSPVGDVTAAATVNLGAGGTLAFADSSAIDWTGGTLTITGTVPNTWVRLVRSGITITAYKSTNGTSWTSVGSTTNTTFASTCYIGLAVGSGSTTTLNTSQFSNVSVTP